MINLEYNFCYFFGGAELEKFKNFIYDKNDIVIALVVVVIAAFIITGRIDAIMNYPSTLIAQPGEVTKAPDSTDQGSGAGNGTAVDPGVGTDTGAGNGTGSSVDPNAGAGTGTGNGTVVAPNAGNGTANPGSGTTPPSNGTGTNPPSSGTGTTPPPAVNYTITVPPGSSGDAIAGILLNNGLIMKKSDFLIAVTALGADKKLKAGTFTIPKGSTPADIVGIITK